MRRLRGECYRSYPGRSAGNAPDKRFKATLRSKPYKKAAVEPAEVSFTLCCDKVRFSEILCYLQLSIEAVLGLDMCQPCIMGVP